MNLFFILNRYWN